MSRIFELFEYSNIRIASPIYDEFERPEQELEFNLRNLLWAILDFEAKKISTESKRLKKEGNGMDRPYLENGLDDDNINVFTLVVNSNSLTTEKQATSSQQEDDYDILRRLKGLELPEPPGLEKTEKKPVGLLQKIVNKFGMKVVPTTTAAGGKAEKAASGARGGTSPVKSTAPATVATPPATAVTTPTTAVTKPATAVDNVTTAHESLSSPTEIKATRKPLIHTISYSQEDIIFDVGPDRTPKTKRRKTTKRKTTTSKTTTTKTTTTKTTTTKATTTTVTTTKPPSTTTEAVGSIPGHRLCDIDATMNHVLKMQRQLSKEEFERFAANLTCYKYRRPPKNFLIVIKGKKKNPKQRRDMNYFPDEKIPKDINYLPDENIRKDVTNLPYEKIKWDWIRSKRSLDDIDENIGMYQAHPYFYPVLNKPIKKYDPSPITVTVKTYFVTEITEDNPTHNNNDVRNRQHLKRTHRSYRNRFPDGFEGMRNKNPYKHNRRMQRNKFIPKINNEEETSRSVDFKDIKNEFEDNSNVKWTLDDVNFVNDDDYFEPFDKDEFGIYRSRKRSKRNPAGLRDLEAMLRGLPYGGKANESYAMVGDAVIIYCLAPSSGSRVSWKTDRPGLLALDNVVVRGQRIFIRRVGAKNLGVYTCKRGKAHKSVKLQVITLPTFKVGITPVYAIEKKCFYNDLRAIKSLGRQMTRECCSSSGDPSCSVEMEEPMCMEDRLEETTYVRSTVSLSLRPRRTPLTCSGRCRRDLHAARALLAATNLPVLAAVRVVLSHDGVNRSLVPTWPAKIKRAVVTHTLRRKELGIKFRGPDLPPGTMSFVAICPAGYYLVSAQKICVACPVGSTSSEGQNECKPLPARKLGRRRRCQWWWYPGYGYCAAWWAALALAAGAALAHSRRSKDDHEERRTMEGRPARAQPRSPSRIILAKLFRNSYSSTKATDSQETKFGLWKEKHAPPPLPPIDFDF